MTPMPRRPAFRIPGIAAARRPRGLLVAAVALFATCGCAFNRPLTDEQRFQLQHPPAAVASALEHLLPRIVADLRNAENANLGRGSALTADQSKLATRIGVAHPERVRVVIVSEFPTTSDPALAVELKSRFGLGTNPRSLNGLTMGHVIFIKPNRANERWLLAHELTHVAQYEALGFDQFAREYLQQMILVGSAQAPLEQAARMNEHLGRE